MTLLRGFHKPTWSRTHQADGSRILIYLSWIHDLVYVSWIQDPIPVYLVDLESELAIFCCVAGTPSATLPRTPRLSATLPRTPSATLPHTPRPPCLAPLGHPASHPSATLPRRAGRP